jgi:hypothetical protein
MRITKGRPSFPAEPASERGLKSGVTLPLCRCRVAVGSNLGTSLGNTAKCVRRTARGAAGNGLGTTIKYMRSTMNGFSGNDLGAMIKCL